MTNIGYRAFEGCTSLKSVDIPNSVTKIGRRSFKGCTSLQSIDIPNSITTIENGAFSGCISLKDLRIEDDKHTLYLHNWEDSPENEAIFYDCPLTTLYIGRNLSYETNEGWHSSPFRDMTTLISVTISNCVTEIRKEAFSSCEVLKSIDVSKENPNYASLDGVLYDKELKTIIKFPCNKRITEYNIPNSVTNIGYCAFEGCSSLQSIKIPKSVTNIGYCAFGGCTSLKNVDIPNNVTLIENDAFSGCSALQSINIPNSVTNIGIDAFSECSALQSIDIPNSVTTIGYAAFKECSALQSIDIPNSVTTIGDYAFGGCKALQSIHIRITDIENADIGEWAFNSIDTNNCVLYISPGRRWAYRHHPVFGKFKNIEIEKQD